jgi:hypothetical protein
MVETLTLVEDEQQVSYLPKRLLKQEIQFRIVENWRVLELTDAFLEDPWL